MAIAIIAALFSGKVAFSAWFLLVPAIGAGAAIGAWLAAKVEMTAMPQLVAILHSFVGLAAVLVGISAYVFPHAGGHGADLAHTAGDALNNVALEGAMNDAAEKTAAVVAPVKQTLLHNIEVILGVFIGGLTFTGSVVAWGKLDGRIDSKPMLLPARHMINLAALFFCLLYTSPSPRDQRGSRMPSSA